MSKKLDTEKGFLGGSYPQPPRVREINQSPHAAPAPPAAKTPPAPRQQPPDQRPRRTPSLNVRRSFFSGLASSGYS